MQRRPAPERQRDRGGLGRGTGIAGAQCTPRVPEQLLELQRVDGSVLERVSVGRGDDRVLAQRSPKTGDVMLDSVARGGRQVVSP